MSIPPSPDDKIGGCNDPTDESDDDDYYERLAANGLSDPMDGAVENDAQNLKVEHIQEAALTEEEWIQAMERKQESGIFLAEDHAVWQIFGRSTSSTEQTLKLVYPMDCGDDSSRSEPQITNTVPCNQKKAMESLNRFVFTHLPLTCPLFRYITQPVPHTKVYTDNEENPSVCLVMLPPRRGSNKKEVTASLFLSPDLPQPIHPDLVESIARTILHFAWFDMKWKKCTSIVFRALDNAHKDVIREAFFKKFHGSYISIEDDSEWISPCGHFVLSDPFNVKESTSIRQGYEFVNLTAENVYIINETWAYKGEGTQDLIVGMIASYPSVGIRHIATNTLCSWMLTYENLSLGMLFTLPEHRGKGLARSVVIELCKRWQEKNYGFQPYAYAVDSNDASRALLTSINLIKRLDVQWWGFSFQALQ